MNTGRYLYFTLSHRLSQSPVITTGEIPFSLQLYGVIPVFPRGTVTSFKEELDPVGSTVIRIQKICY